MAMGVSKTQQPKVLATDSSIAAPMAQIVPNIDDKKPTAIMVSWTGCPDVHVTMYRTLQYRSDTAEEETQCMLMFGLQIRRPGPVWDWNTHVCRGRGQRKGECGARQRCIDEECMIVQEGAMVREGLRTTWTRRIPL